MKTMTQEERLDFLVEGFKKDSLRYKDLETPKDSEGKRVLLRSLMNIRMPSPMNEEVLALQDEYLKTRAEEKGIIKLEDISDFRVKNAVEKWSGDKDVLIKALPRLASMIEDGVGKHIGEGFLTKKPKKLKEIPAREIVTYIATEMNGITDVNGQQMLAGYTCSKLEVADFYLSCIDNKDDRYIVPHTRDFIIRYQSDLNRLLTQILKIRPVNRNDRIWQINVNYPG